MQQNDPLPARYRGQRLGAASATTADEDLMAAVPGPECVPYRSRQTSRRSVAWFHRS
jgi:hypothetical protein